MRWLLHADPAPSVRRKPNAEEDGANLTPEMYRVEVRIDHGHKQDSAIFHSCFMTKGFGSFFSADGLVITAIDGEARRKARGLLQPVIDTALPLCAAIEHQSCDEFILPWYPKSAPTLPPSQVEVRQVGACCVGPLSSNEISEFVRQKM
ncbi:cytochrome P450 [Comamonas thiooxydans]|uniref:hypothetical protein n=1 Tax=Comamonas thiooxydans TaxID=363952 RepID=UPI00244D1C7E|nr:hypothetical protein [Comamonas thiooxydans]MDH1254376.1 cytochrome P450 [Comamonas thiooxydans]